MKIGNSNPVLWRLLISLIIILFALIMWGAIETYGQPSSYISTYYTVADDSGIYAGNAVYLTARNSATGTLTPSTFTIGQLFQSGSYTVYRSFLIFDTRPLLVNQTVTQAWLSFLIYSDASTTDFDIVILSGQPTYPHVPIVTGDFDRTHYSGDYGGTFNTAGKSTGRHYTIEIDPDIIEKDDYTKICLMSSRDISATSPSGAEAISIYGNGGTWPAFLTIAIDHNYAIEGDPSDGLAYHSDPASLDHCRHETTATSVLDTGPPYNSIEIGQIESSPKYIRRGFMYFDTSGIPDNFYVTDARIAVYVSSITRTPGNEFTIYVESGLDEAYPHKPFIASDYDETLYTNGKNLGQSLNTSDMTAGFWYDISLSKTLINLDGWTKIILKSSMDIDEWEYGLGSPYNNYISINAQEYMFGAKLLINGCPSAPAALGIATTHLDNGYASMDYVFNMTLSGGYPNFIWTVTTSGWSWLEFGINGSLYGTLPATPGTYYLTVNVTDGIGQGDEHVFSIVVSELIVGGPPEDQIDLSIPDMGELGELWALLILASIFVGGFKIMRDYNRQLGRRR